MKLCRAPCSCAEGNKLTGHATAGPTDMWWHPYYAASATPLMPSTGEWQGPAMLPHDEQVEIKCIANVHYSPAM